MSRVVAPLFLIAIGVGWLLSAKQVLPGVSWIWILLLATAGLSILLARRLTRSSLIVGPFLLLCATGSFLRQTGRISAEIEIPALIIALGVLLLIARLAPLPEALPSRGASEPRT
jgi:hypothetical protein